ncbi:MAG: hypothetical protein ACR2NW_05490 [Thermodesulfobacteriota bacterium]
MKILKKLNYIIICLLFVALANFSVTNAFSSNIDFQLIGFDSSEPEAIDGEGNPVVPDTDEFGEGGNNDSSDNDSGEYDPENPYGQWE